ncbi:MAG: isocitrate/isopropylmalate dehydrogenase family protein, partial [Clostridia bacterium]|nr:isocitrate/isopropylmalate dehydrogenase family protein [Clostridia bacterium]
YAALDKLIIGVCDGDGIGPIICSEATRVLEILLASEIAGGKVELRRIEGLTLENRMAKEQSVPDDVLAAIKECHVLLKGPTTTPKGGTGAKELESANVALRRELDLFANVRPVSVPSEGIDWTFYRENTEGEYVLGSRGVEIPGVLCCDFKVTTDLGTARIARAAYEFARKNGKTNVAIVTKANIMKKTDGKFARICREIAEKEYPELVLEDWYIDIMAANLVNPAIRSKFEVFVLPNLYGDIITDEAAQIQGGVGTAGSANVGGRYAMFEAVHGSAPRMIEEGIGDYANPSSILKAVEMLLRHVGKAAAADRLANAMRICTADGAKLKVTGDRDGATAKAFTDYLIENL